MLFGTSMGSARLSGRMGEPAATSPQKGKMRTLDTFSERASLRREWADARPSSVPVATTRLLPLPWLRTRKPLSMRCWTCLWMVDTALEPTPLAISAKVGLRPSPCTKARMNFSTACWRLVRSLVFMDFKVGVEAQVVNPFFFALFQTAVQPVRRPAIEPVPHLCHTGRRP